MKILMIFVASQAANLFENAHFIFIPVWKIQTLLPLYILSPNVKYMTETSRNILFPRVHYFLCISFQFV